MTQDPSNRDEELIAKVRAGNQEAIREMFVIIYAELRAAANNRLGANASKWTLQATALANEAFIRMHKGPVVGLSSRQHLLNIAAEVVDRVIIDHVRAKRAKKRGGDRVRVPLDAMAVPAVQTFGFDHYESVSQAMEQLRRESPEHADVARLRYMLGLSVQETAEVTGHSVHKVKHMSQFVNSWLRLRLSEATGDQ